jgi:uncharacterized protein (DUF1778 family)
MAQPQLKISPINLRALASQKILIDQAAALVHKNRSDFMLEAACKEAENILLDQRLFLVTNESYQAFVKSLDSPIDENQKLHSLLKSNNPWDN